MKIHAAVARAHKQPLSIEELDLDEPRNDEILVKLAAVGVCHTDLATIHGQLPTPLPVVLGHEGAGIVELVGDNVSKVAPGDHVVMTFDSCGHCPSCDAGDVSYCYEFFPRNFFATRADGSTTLKNNDEVIHGNFFGQSSFATHIICNTRNIVKVPEDLPLQHLAPFGCGIQTGAGAVINALTVEPGTAFAVFGVGSVGLSAVITAATVGAATIIAVDIQQDRLKLAKDLGATHTINPQQEDAGQRIMEITGHGVQYSLDTTGSDAVIRQAVESLCNRGVCGILGVSPPGTNISLDVSHFMSGGRRLIGIVEGESKPDVFIPKLVGLYRQGRFPVDKMMSFYSLEQINKAIDDSASGKAIKPVIVFE